MLPSYLRPLVLVALLLALPACDTEDPNEDARLAAFEVTGDSPRAFVIQRIDEFTSAREQRLPWGTNFPATPGLTLELAASSIEAGRRIEIVIYYDGEAVREAVSEDGTEVGVTFVVPE